MAQMNTDLIRGCYPPAAEDIHFATHDTDGHGYFMHNSVIRVIRG
jgi:hypothetical protein